MHAHTLILFALTEAALALSPGPAVMLAISNGSRHGLRGAALGAGGIELGNATWFVFSAAGLTTILLASSTAFEIIRYAGAAYLVFLGAKLLVSRRDTAPNAAPAPRGAIVVQGFLTQMGNPKAVLFFGALLPQFIDLAAPFGMQFLVLGALTLAIDYSALLLYGWVAERGARAARGPRLWRWFDRAAGAFLLGAGARMAA